MYDPLTDPLELPVQILTADCRAGAPLIFPRHAGATPGTTLNSAFGNVIWDVACARRHQGLPACNHEQDRCQQPGGCSVSWLYKPRSEIHKLDLTRPVLFDAPELWTGKPCATFTLSITLWGRHAIRSRAVVETTLHTMGRRGLGPDGARVPFAITRINADPPRTLAERVTALTGGYSWQRGLLVFETPFLHRETVDKDKNPPEKEFLAGGELSLVTILGNRAQTLSNWDMEDRELKDLDKDTRKQLAKQAKQMVETLAKAIHITSSIEPDDRGHRFSKKDGKLFPLQGFIGQAGVVGNLNPILPWLLALALGGGGQHRAMGFGVVRLWLEP